MLLLAAAIAAAATATTTACAAADVVAATKIATITCIYACIVPSATATGVTCADVVITTVGSKSVTHYLRQEPFSMPYKQLFTTGVGSRYAEFTSAKARGEWRSGRRRRARSTLQCG